MKLLVIFCWIAYKIVDWKNFQAYHKKGSFYKLNKYRFHLNCSNNQIVSEITSCIAINYQMVILSILTHSHACEGDCTFCINKHYFKILISFTKIYYLEKINLRVIKLLKLYEFLSRV